MDPPHRSDSRGRSAAEALPSWYRTAAAAAWRFIVLVAAVVALVYAMGYLKIVVLPIIVALLATTLLLAPTSWLRARPRVGDGLAAAATMLAAFLVVVAIGAAVVPTLVGQSDELGAGLQDGVREATNLLSEPPLNLSEREIRARVDAGIERLRENSGPLTRGLQSGAIILGEIITGLIVAVMLTFFFLKDGGSMWRWLVGLAPRHRRENMDEIGHRVFAALGGYVRGIAMVGLVDAVLIGIALAIIGVPLVIPLMILTFFGAFVPLVGAFVAGLAAVLIALVFNGVVPALIVLGVIVVIQQVEGDVLYPLLMGRTMPLHPAVILIALTAGGILAGIIGVFLAVPVAGSAAVVLDYVRGGPAPDSPPTNEADDPDAEGSAAAGA